MAIVKHLFKIIAPSVLLAGSIGASHADSYVVCYEHCTVAHPVVTHKVDKYEDKQNFCGYDVEGEQQVCVDAEVVQIDETRITHTAGVNTQQLNAETMSDVKYTTKVSFSE